MKTKEYTVLHWDVDKKKKVEEKFLSLLQARVYANGMNRMNRFISLKNIKGTTLPL